MDAEDGTYVEDWNELKVSELREELEARGLDASGKRQDLIARLEEADMKAEAEEEPESSGVPLAEPSPEEAPTKPVPPVSEPLSASPVPSGAVFHAEFDIPADWEEDDEDQDLAWKLMARDAAIAAGHEVFPAAYSAYFHQFGSRDGRRTVVYQVPTVRQLSPESSYNEGP